MSQEKGLRLGFMVFGNIMGLLLFLSPAVTFKRIITNKSTEQFSGIPYVLTLLTCLLAAWYDMPFISPKNYLIAMLNGFGALVELAYVVIFLVYAPKREKIKISVLLAFIVAVFSTIALVSTLVFHPTEMNYRRLLCGFAATSLSIIMYASPLSVMRMVITNKSVEYMPFFPSLFIFLSGTTWLIYGFIRKDKFIYIPNGCGCILGAVQLILYSVYCKNKTPPAEESVRMEEGNAS